MPTILIPAYGRKYATQLAATADWKEGLDFRIEGGPYCSIRDIDALKRNYGTISIRFKAGRYFTV